ncbi:uncharacterized protein [Nicotiana tomentosiformis]|uniref:uncharacterized protein n=1 Tax=Nicotiana tomentosiformis TaxID=4098 RepID=UPI00388C77A4
MGHFVRIKTSDLIPVEDMPFPKKLNMKLVAQIPDVVPQLKEWVEDLVSQKPYSERAWMKLSKGRWEARNHGLPKDVTIRPPSEGEDMPLESLALKQGDEKKRKRAPSSLNSEKKTTKRRLARKAKESTSALPSNSIRHLRDEFEEEKDTSELVARVRTALSRTEEVFEKALASVFHHEAFLQIREELTQHEAEIQELTEKRDTYKILSEKLQTELEAARKEHTEWVEQVNRVLEDSDGELDSVANDLILHVRQRLEKIGQLQAHVDAMQTETEEFKKNMDLITSQKEVV